MIWCLLRIEAVTVPNRTITAFIMQQDKPTINLTVPTGWDKLDDHQLRYVFGLLAQGFPSPQVKTYCLFRWTGMQVMHRYRKGWWCILLIILFDFSAVRPIKNRGANYDTASFFKYLFLRE